MDRSNVYRGVFLASVLAGLTGFYVSGAPEWLTLSALRENLSLLSNLRLEHPWLSGLGFVILYVVFSAAAIPGASVLTVGGGALFGFWQGVLFASFGSSIGAVVALAGSRYLFRDYVRTKFPDLIAQIDRGIAKQGWVYLASLRLIPVVPFFAVNLAFGVTTVSIWRFYIVSQLAMLPASMVYVNAGSNIDQLDSLSNILTPQVILSLLMLAALGPLSRGVLALIKKPQ